MLAYTNETLACYDWNIDKMIEEWEDYGPIKSMCLSPN